MKKLIFAIAFIIFPLLSVAQITLSSDFKDGFFVITSTNAGYGKWTVTVIFDNKDPLSKLNDFSRVVGHGKAEILRLRIDVNRDINYSFSYRSFQGVANPKINERFVYRIPLEAGRGCHAVPSFDLNEMFQKPEAINSPELYETNDGSSGLGFYGDKGDPVYAARKGIVVSVRDNAATEPVKGMNFKSDDSEIIVQHNDGTFAMYGYIEEGSILVNCGDIVYPDTKLGTLGTLDGNDYHVYFHVYYIATENRGLSDGDINYVTVHPLFATTDGNIAITETTICTPVVTEELITTEMSKREIRARK